jgi:hypothetical protein
MIPSALIARLKMLAESTIQSAEPVRPLRPDPQRSDPLPFNPGDRVRASIVNLQPDGTYRAQVAGRPLTLSLPAPARPGEEIDLVITGRPTEPGKGDEQTTITARLAGPAASSAPSPQLSRSAQLIGALLTGTGAKSIPLTPGTSLMPAAGANARQIAPALREAVARSGVFYESHQAQWVDGRTTLDALLQEPQAKLPPGTTLALPTRAAAPPNRSAQASALLPEDDKERVATSEPGQGHDVTAILHKQLDTLATQQLSWQMQLWPGQQLDWQIDAPFDRDARAADGETPEWRTRLRLILPRLGDVSAEMAISGNRVSLRLQADGADHVEQLKLARPALARALEAAGLQLSQATVAHHA